MRTFKNSQHQQSSKQIYLGLVGMLMSGILLTGCQKPANDTNANTTASATPTTATTATPTKVDTNLPTYNVLIDATYPPFEMKNPDGTVGGMEVELFNAIAKDQGFNANYIPHAWDGIFDSLNAKQGDMVVSAVGVTE